MITAYLAGPVTGISWNTATGWRDGMRERLAESNVNCVSPLRGKNYLGQELSIKDSYEQHAMSTERAILARDYYDVDHCDVLFVNYLGAKTRSIGTISEVARAYFQNKYIIIVMESGNVHDHAFTRQQASVIVDNLEEGEEYLAEFAKGYA